MEIKIGGLYQNRTLRYLFPSIRLYGSTFIGKFNMVHKLAYGIHDALLDGTPYEDQKKLCMLIDKLVRPNDYEGFIKWIRNQEYYIVDYPYDDTETGRMQMLMIEFPEKESDIYDKFLESKYSKMYVRTELNTFFKEDSYAKDVITKSKKIAQDFVNKVNTKYGSNVSTQDLKAHGSEFDFPWEKEEEIFNYKVCTEGKPS